MHHTVSPPPPRNDNIGRYRNEFAIRESDTPLGASFSRKILLTYFCETFYSYRIHTFPRCPSLKLYRWKTKT